MNIIDPIVIVAVVLGLSSNKMTPGHWVVMVVAIMATLTAYGLKQ